MSANDQPIPKKSLGQHWLEDSEVLGLISDYAEIDSRDVVLEIGPGYGTLTSQLVKNAGQVIAVELDDKLANKLPVFVDARNLEVVHQNILEFDLNRLPDNYKVVANIPYYLTSNLLRVLSESTNPPVLIVLLVQKEVAQRLIAEPGQMSILAVTTQFFWDIGSKEVVNRKLFSPPPKVDSQIVVLTRKTKFSKDINTKSFFRLVKMGFSARRKTLLNSLSNGLRIDKGMVETILIQANIDPKFRPQTLSIEDWLKLYKYFREQKLV